MMSLRWICILFTICIIIVTGQKAHGQSTSLTNKTVLSNKNFLQNNVLADSIFSLCKQDLIGHKYKESLALISKILPLYQLIGETKKVADCFNYTAVNYYFLGDYVKSIIYYNKELEISRKIGYKKGIASALNNMGGIYNDQGDYLKALNNYKQAALLFKELGDTANLAGAIHNVGLIYGRAKEYAIAVRYFRQAYIFYKKLNDQEAVSQMLKSMGSLRLKEGKYTEAFTYLNRSLHIAETLKDKQLIMFALVDMGEVFYKQLAYRRALPYFTRSLAYANEMGNLQCQSESKIAIGNILHQLKDEKEAVDACRNGLMLAEKLKATYLQKSGCNCLYQSYKTLGNIQKALYYYEQVNRFNDSLNIAEISNKIMGIEFQKRQLVDSLTHVKKEHITQLKHQTEVRQQEKQRNIIIITLGFILLIAAGLWNRLLYTRKSRTALQVEKDRSEALLLNILPEEIAEELKEKGSVNARDYNLVSILFTDFKSFTQTAEKMSPQSLVEEINSCFRAFDLITETYQIEKIKTIGDAYMAAGGIPNADENSLKNIVLAGLAMQEFMAQRFVENQAMGRPAFEMRLGIHAGPIVAGIVGVKKFQYDVWGDTVNTASRMESNSQVGKVNISETLYQFIKHEDCFRFECRGHIHAKGKGDMAMYFVEKSCVSEAVA